MSNSSKTQKIMAISPHVEMWVRRMYRSKLGLSLLKNNLRTKKKLVATNSSIDLKSIKSYLRSIGIKKGDIMIVHSAFGSFKNSGLSPDDIIDFLIDIVGDQGTLVMPVIRKYPESPTVEEALDADVSDIEFTYDVKKSQIWTGIIPKTLMNKPGSTTSKFPINTITAFGPESGKMIQGELEGDSPTPNGVNSSWKYCTDQDAWVVSLGVDLTHSLTMIHTAEDVKNELWPIKGWYRKKKFKIIDGEQVTFKTILERHPKWGMLHFGERTLCKNLIDDKIMRSSVVEGVLIESLKSKSLFDYLNSKNKNGYPYFWVKKDLDKWF
jgi:aminoglycoside 3-N-acetyltransferase